MKNINHTSRWRWVAAECLIVALAFWIRLHYVLTIVVPNAIRGDAVQYYNCAWNLVHHSTFSTDSPADALPTPNSFRDPGFPALLAGWLKFSPDSNMWYWGVLVSHAVLGATTVWFVMRICGRWLSPGATLAAGLTAALWPHSITNCGYLLTETLCGFFCAAAVWLSGRLSDGGQTKVRASLAGLAYGLASLTNAILTPFPLLLGAAIAWKRLLPKRTIIIFIGASMFLPALWTIRTASLPVSTASTSATRALINLIEGSYPGFLDSYNDALVLRDPKALELYMEVERSQDRSLQAPAAEIGRMLKRLSQRPLSSLKWYILDKPAMLWGWSIRVGMGDIYIYPTEHSPFDTDVTWRIVASLAHALNAPLGLLAGFFAIYALSRLGSDTREPMRAMRLGLSRDLIALLFAYVSLIYTVLQAEPRYATPFRGFEFALAISALAFLWSHLSKLRNVIRQSSS